MKNLKNGEGRRRCINKRLEKGSIQPLARKRSVHYRKTNLRGEVLRTASLYRLDFLAQSAAHSSYDNHISYYAVKPPPPPAPSSPMAAPSTAFGRYVCQLRKVTLQLCKVSGASTGAR